jgi:hypothetical protein
MKNRLDKCLGRTSIYFFLSLKISDNSMNLNFVKDESKTDDSNINNNLNYGDQDLTMMKIRKQLDKSHQYEEFRNEI